MLTKVIFDYSRHIYEVRRLRIRLRVYPIILHKTLSIDLSQYSPSIHSDRSKETVNNVSVNPFFILINPTPIHI